MFPLDTRILIADDMQTMRKLICKSIKGLGYFNLLEVEDGLEAWKVIELASLKKSPIQLIIADWHMPKMTGIELLRKVRAAETAQKVPFLLLTSDFDREQVIEAIQAGMSAYITKPFSVATLSEKLLSIWTQSTPQKPQSKE